MLAQRPGRAGWRSAPAPLQNRTPVGQLAPRQRGHHHIMNFNQRCVRCLRIESPHHCTAQAAVRMPLMRQGAGATSAGVLPAAPKEAIAERPRNQMAAQRFQTQHGNPAHQHPGHQKSQIDVCLRSFYKPWSRIWPKSGQTHRHSQSLCPPSCRPGAAGAPVHGSVRR